LIPGPTAIGESVRRAWSVTRKELRQLMRDQLTLGFVVAVPIVQLLLFGYAINQDVRHVPTAVVDLSGTETSRRLIGQLEATQTFDVVRRATDEDEGRKLIAAGEAQVVVMIPVDFSRNYFRGRGA